MPTDLEGRIRAQLATVLDPCSTFTERPQSIVELGLVEDVTVDDGAVTVNLLPTNQLCMYVPHMSDEITERVGELAGVESVTVETVADAVWTPDRMTAAAAAEREAYFEERVAAHDIEPAWDGTSWGEEVTVGTSQHERPDR